MHGESPRYMLALAKELDVLDVYPIDGNGIPINKSGPFANIDDDPDVDFIGLSPDIVDDMETHVSTQLVTP